MEEENKKTVSKVKREKKIEAKPLPVDKEKAREIERGLEEKVEEKKEEKETDKLKEDKKHKKEAPKIKKEEAVAYGADLHLSKKQGVYICRFIKNKSIDKAIHDLEDVIKMKRAVPFKGEIPHRKGGFVGRYPVKAAGYFINLLKSLKGNVIVNGLELENTKIVIASTSWARRPRRSGGRAAKRSNIILKAKEVLGRKK